MLESPPVNREPLLPGFLNLLQELLGFLPFYFPSVLVLFIAGCDH